MPDDPAHHPCSLRLELFCNELLHLIPYIIAFPNAFVRLEPCPFGANYRATFEDTRAEILGLRARQRQALGGYV